jgi:hypothetical protein
VISGVKSTDRCKLELLSSQLELNVTDLDLDCHEQVGAEDSNTTINLRHGAVRSVVAAGSQLCRLERWADGRKATVSLLQLWPLFYH